MDDPLTVSTPLRFVWLDTSALAKIYLHKLGTEDILSVLCDNSVMVFTAEYCVHEFYGILKRRAAKNSENKNPISLEEYLRYVFLLRCHIRDGGRIKIYKYDFTDTDLFDRVKAIMHNNNLDLVDAIQFIILTKGMLGCLAGESGPVLASSDEGILGVARERDIRTWNPEIGALPNFTKQY